MNDNLLNLAKFFFYTLVYFIGWKVLTTLRVHPSYRVQNQRIINFQADEILFSLQKKTGNRNYLERMSETVTFYKGLYKEFKISIVKMSTENIFCYY